MEEEHFSIVVFGETGYRTLTIREKTFRKSCYLLVFSFLALTLFLCDYVQIRRKTVEIDRLRQEMAARMSQLQLFSSGISHLENQFSRLSKLDRRIHEIANVYEKSVLSEGSVKISND